MNYYEVIQYLYDQLPMFHRVGHSAYKANLDTAIYLDNYFRTPHQHYRTIHVAGTNGKGSVSHMLAAILQTAGYKTGLFTSPHLKDFRERIRVNGEMIPEVEVVDFIERSQDVFSIVRPSFFEMTSALAFYYFSKANVDVAVIEVGMGGRLDSTNIITPILSVITNIGLDHTEFLGDTPGKIAIEKAGIIKENVPVVIGEFHEETWPVFAEKAKTFHSRIKRADEIFKSEYSLVSLDHKQVLTIYRSGEPAFRNLKLDLLGFYQRKNICTVLAAVEQLKEAGLLIPDKSIYEGLADVTQITGLQGRWQSLGYNPLIICDTGHNKDGITWVVEQIKAVPFKKLHMVVGFVRDKDIDSILKLLPTDATYYFTNASIPRALEAEELKKKAAGYGLLGDSYQSVKLALETARKNASKEDFIFIGGSTFVVAEVV
ncbi:MAG TPA: folylpolyglutamate synthase/dihydrofolate synthase family protein [Bacteroidales bacterium]